MFIQYPELAFITVQLFLVEKFILLNYHTAWAGHATPIATHPDSCCLFELAKLSASIDFASLVSLFLNHYIFIRL